MVGVPHSASPRALCSQAGRRVVRVEEHGEPRRVAGGHAKIFAQPAGMARSTDRTLTQGTGPYTPEPLLSSSINGTCRRRRRCSFCLVATARLWCPGVVLSGWLAGWLGTTVISATANRAATRAEQPT